MVNVTTGSDNNRDGLSLDRPAGIPRNLLHGRSYIDLDLNLSHDFALTRAAKPGPIATVSESSPFETISAVSTLNLCLCVSGSKANRAGSVSLADQLSAAETVIRRNRE